MSSLTCQTLCTRRHTQQDLERWCSMIASLNFRSLVQKLRKFQHGGMFRAVLRGQHLTSGQPASLYKVTSGASPRDLRSLTQQCRDEHIKLKIDCEILLCDYWCDSLIRVAHSRSSWSFVSGRSQGPPIYAYGSPVWRGWSESV